MGVGMEHPIAHEDVRGLDQEVRSVGDGSMHKLDSIEPIVEPSIQVSEQLHVGETFRSQLLDHLLGRGVPLSHALDPYTGGQLRRQLCVQHDLPDAASDVQKTTPHRIQTDPTACASVARRTDQYNNNKR